MDYDFNLDSSNYKSILSSSKDLKNSNSANYLIIKCNYQPGGLTSEKSSALLHRSLGNIACLSNLSLSSYTLPYMKPFMRVEWAWISVNGKL